MDTTDSTSQNDNNEQHQIQNSLKQQSFNQTIQESVGQAADPAAWNKAPEEVGVSNVATEGKSSLYQDQSLPLSLSDFDAGKSGEGSAGQQSADPMHQYMNDLNSVLSSSSNLLDNLGSMIASNGNDPSAAQQQLDSAALSTAQSVINLDSQLLSQFGLPTQGATSSSDSGSGEVASTSGNTAAAASDSAVTPGTTNTGITAAGGEACSGGGVVSSPGTTAGSDTATTPTVSVAGSDAATTPAATVSGSDTATTPTATVSGSDTAATPTAAAGSDAATTPTSTAGSTAAGSEVGSGVGAVSTPANDAGSDSSTTPATNTSGTAVAGSDSGSSTTTPTTSTDGTLSSGLQAVANQMGLVPVYDAQGDDLVPLAGPGTNSTGELSQYGQANANGSFTITTDPGGWGGDLTTPTNYTGTQLDIATVQFDPSTVQAASFAGGSATSWPAVWGDTVTGAQGHIEDDVMEDFSSTSMASTIHDWPAGQPQGQGGSTPINMSDFNFNQPTEIASLINNQNDTITDYINGQQVASFNYPNSDYDQLATQPFEFILGSGNGDPFTIDNVEVLQPQT